ncbi:hypothetical protein ACWCQQ_29580 [Streptomyces sp. NPDC002143]
MLDLYARTWQGEQLGDDEYVISADEKTSIQARCRCHPTLAPGKARAMRVNHTYGRGSALAYLAAYDVHAAKVSGRTIAVRRRPTGSPRRSRTRSWSTPPRARLLAQPSRDDLLARLDRHTADHHEESSVVPAA